MDDVPQICSVLKDYIFYYKHEASTAIDGLAGWKAFQEGNFDVVMADKSMPGLDGYELASKVKEVSPKTPVIILTGFDDTDPDDYPKDIDFIVTKPITLKNMEETLQRILENYFS